MIDPKYPFFYRNGDKEWMAQTGYITWYTGTKDVVKAIEMVYTKNPLSKGSKVTKLAIDSKS